MRPGLRRSLLLLAANAGAAALAWGALEGAASFFVEKPEDSLAESWQSWRVNHALKPGVVNAYRHFGLADPEFPEQFTHARNSKGWVCDHEVSVRKPPGTYRIFFVGDSFIEGPVPMERSLPGAVGRGLAELARGRPGAFEVINAGVGSYSPLIYYILVRYSLLAYSPDLLVVNVDMTDDYDDWKYRQTAVFDAQGDPWAAPPRDPYRAPFIDLGGGMVRSTPLARLQLWLYRNSYLYNLVLRLRAIRRLDAAERARLDAPDPAAAPSREEGGAYARWKWCARDWDRATEENVAKTLDVLRRLARLCRRSGVRLAFSASPHYRQLTGEWSARPQRALARLAKEEGVPFFDVLPEMAALARGAPRSRFYYRGDMHLNPRGYAVWSKACLAFLTDPRNALMPAWLKR